MLALDIVTAEGELVRVSETEHPELYWAARGAGPGFFGVVVGYKVRVFDLPGSIETVTLVYPLEKVGDLARWTSEVCPTLPPNVELVLAYAPDGGGRRVCMFMATVYTDSHEQATRILAPLARCPVAGQLAKDVAVTPFNAMFAGIGAMFPHGKRYAVDTLWLEGDAATLLTEAAARYTQAPSESSVMIATIVPPPPAGAPPLPDCAFSMVGQVYLGCYSIWDDAAHDAANTDWLRQTAGGFSKSTTRYYLGEADLAADESRSRKSFSEANWKRLSELRRKHDRDGVFHEYLGQKSS